MREYDLLARYAGDEFVAIVQEVGDAQVDDLCGRIENAVANFAMPVRGDKYAKVGISVGSATFDIDGETLDQLLVLADQAMYRIKSEHKRATTSTPTVNVPPPVPVSPPLRTPLPTPPIADPIDDELASVSVN